MRPFGEHPALARRFEGACAAIYPAMLALLLARLWDAAKAQLLVLPLAAIAGLFAADLVSGFFHWLFDTWGTPEVRVIGPLWIRTFREHHRDPDAMLEHDFLETNGSNIFAGVVVCALGLALAPALFPSVACASASLGLALTSQIHKWAHASKRPRAVTFLQRASVILSPELHAEHHRAPHDRRYAITTGWSNALLDRTNIFRALERAITLSTGARPRLDAAHGDRDVVLTAARERVIDEDLAENRG